MRYIIKKSRLSITSSIFLFFISSLIFLIISLWFLYQTIRFLKVAKTTEAVVTHREFRPRVKHFTYVLTIDYVMDGKIQTAKTNMGYGGIFAPKIKDKILIYYDPTNLSHVELKNLFLILFQPVFFVCMGALFLSLTTSTLLQLAKKPKRSSKNEKEA